MYRFFFVIFFFHSVSYAYQCKSPKDISFSQLHTKTDIVENRTAIFSANKRKVFFYSYPDISCQQKGIFIITNDLVYVFSSYNDFYYVEYVSQKGKSVYGWVKKMDLTPYNAHYIGPADKFSIADFSIYKNEMWVSINSESYILNYMIGEHYTSFIGSYPNAVGGLYKYYNHTYPFGEILSSNALYDKRMQDIDNGYRLFSIKLMDRTYLTARGIGVGDTVKKVKNIYQSKNPIDDGSALTYKLGDYFISYGIKNNSVASINIGYEIPEDEKE